MSAILLRGGIFALIWWALTEGRADSWGVGLLFIVLALGASLRLSPPGQTRLSPLGLLGFVGFFLVLSLRGGVQVAAMALRPRLTLAPAQVEIDLRLPPGPAARMLTATLSLLPGTLSVALEGDRLRLHALDGRLPIEHEVRAAERRIAHLFGVRL